MKHRLFCLACILLANISITFAQDYIEPIPIDDLYYYLDDTNLTAQVTIMPIGRYTMDTITIPEYVEYNSTTYTVTSIGYRAFYENPNLREVTIPNSVTSIGEIAFMYCKNLTHVTIPNSITSIGEGAFSFCSSLANVTLPNSLTSIGATAFSVCSALTSVIIPNSITSIEHGVFYACSALTSVIIPNSVTSIGSGAFASCSSLASIDIPNSVTSIGDYAFEGSALTSLIIPINVTNIGYASFSTCSGLSNIVVENLNPVYDSRNNCNAIIETASNKLYAGCKNTIIPPSITSIGSGAFKGCLGLTNMTIPNSITSIGENAFWRCYNLTSITISSSVTSIGDGAFCFCSALTSITCEAINPPATGAKTFQDVDTSIPLYVPSESITAYKGSHVWARFTNIQAIGAEEGIITTTLESQQGSKFSINGQLLIQRGDEVFNAQGARVK